MKDSQIESQEEAFVRFAKRELDQSLAQLPRHVQTRLRLARRSALEQTPPRRVWVWPATGLATACATLLAWFLVTGTPEPNPITHLEDVDLLTTAEPLDLYEDLEFYVWLAEPDHAS